MINMSKDWRGRLKAALRQLLSAPQMWRRVGRDSGKFRTSSIHLASGARRRKVRKAESNEKIRRARMEMSNETALLPTHSPSVRAPFEFVRQCGQFSGSMERQTEGEQMQRGEATLG